MIQVPVSWIDVHLGESFQVLMALKDLQYYFQMYQAVKPWRLLSRLSVVSYSFVVLFILFITLVIADFYPLTSYFSLWSWFAILGPSFFSLGGAILSIHVRTESFFSRHQFRILCWGGGCMLQNNHVNLVDFIAWWQWCWRLDV